MKFAPLSILTTLLLVNSIKAVEQVQEDAPAVAPVTTESGVPVDQEGSSSSGEAMDFKLDEDMMKQLRELFGNDVDFDELFGGNQEEKNDL